MRRLALLATLLAFAALSAGCAEGGAMSQLRGGTPEPDPYYREYREDIGLQHERSFAVPVESGARALEVKVDLSSKAATGQLPPGALLTVKLLEPGGEVLASRLVDARTPSMSLGYTELARPGEYVIQVTGRGTTDQLGGIEGGAYYTLAAEVLY